MLDAGPLRCNRDLDDRSHHDESSREDSQPSGTEQNRKSSEGCAHPKEAARTVRGVTTPLAT